MTTSTTFSYMKTAQVRTFLLKAGWYTGNMAIWLADYGDHIDTGAVRNMLKGCCTSDGTDLFRAMECEVPQFLPQL